MYNGNVISLLFRRHTLLLSSSSDFIFSMIKFSISILSLNSIFLTKLQTDVLFSEVSDRFSSDATRLSSIGISK